MPCHDPTGGREWLSARLPGWPAAGVCSPLECSSGCAAFPGKVFAAHRCAAVCGAWVCPYLAAPTRPVAHQRGAKHSTTQHSTAQHSTAKQLTPPRGSLGAVLVAVKQADRASGLSTTPAHNATTASAGVVWCGVVWCGVVWCGDTVVPAHRLLPPALFGAQFTVQFAVSLARTAAGLHGWATRVVQVVSRATAARHPPSTPPPPPTRPRSRARCFAPW